MNLGFTCRHELTQKVYGVLLKQRQTVLRRLQTLKLLVEG